MVLITYNPISTRVVSVHTATPLEAICKANAAHHQIAPNKFFTELFVIKNQPQDYRKNIPCEILSFSPWYTGTGFAIEEKGQPFGNTIEKEFYSPSADKNQTIVYYIYNKDIGASNLMHIFEHGFRSDGEPLLRLINAKNEKHIHTLEELYDADTIILKPIGDIYTFNLTDRRGGIFEKLNGDNSTTLWLPGQSTINLFSRGFGSFPYNITNVNGRESMDSPLGVLFLDNTKQLIKEAAAHLTSEMHPSISRLISALQSRK